MCWSEKDGGRPKVRDYWDLEINTYMKTQERWELPETNRT